MPSFQFSPSPHWKLTQRFGRGKQTKRQRLWRKPPTVAGENIRRTSRVVLNPRKNFLPNYLIDLKNSIIKIIHRIKFLNGGCALKELKSFSSLIVTLGSIQDLSAGTTTTPRAEFLKQIAGKRDVYKPLSGSNPHCYDGVRRNFPNKFKNDSFFSGSQLFLVLTLLMRLKNRSIIPNAKIISSTALVPIVLPKSTRSKAAQKNASMKKLLLLRYFLLNKIKFFLKLKKANTNASTS